MDTGVAFLISGLVFGFGAGISPGPLQALIISETMRHGKGEGTKVAIAPLITDLPIILVILFILTKVEGSNNIIGTISLIGAGYLIYLGIDNLRVNFDPTSIEENKSNALTRGIITNLLNPHPYLFWLTIGGPIIFSSMNIHFSMTFLFIFGFYLLLISSKVFTVLLVERSKAFLRSKYYILPIRISGILLILFAFIFIRDGLQLIGFI